MSPGRRRSVSGVVRSRFRTVRSRLAFDRRAALARRFGIDVRALAALRIAVGALLLADLALRSRDLVAFYTDAGALPRGALRAAFPALSRLSIHALSGAPAVQAALFLVAGAFALSLLVGYRTRLAAVASLVLLASLHARNPLVLNGGDSLLRRLLLWGLLLPLGARWSLDAVRARPDRTGGGTGATSGSGATDGRPGSDPGNRTEAASDAERRRRATAGRVASLASAGLLLQVVLVYAVNAAFKLRSGVWRRGVALQYVFSLDRLTVGLGDVLANYPAVLGTLERLWLAMLVSSVLLVVLTGWRRTLLVVPFALAHLGMVATLRIGLFPVVSVAALIPFLPPRVWDATERAATTLRQGVRERGREWGGGRGRRWKRTAARPGPASGLRAAFRDRLVRAVPADGPTVARWRDGLGSAAAAALLAFVLVWNAAALGYVALPAGASAVADPGERTWDMFADPWRADGWYVVPARTASGRTVDALHGGAVTWDRPPDVASTYPTHRWRMYLVDLRRPGNAGLRPGLAAYLCRRWNARHGEELVELTVYYVEQPTRLDGPEPTRRVELLEYSCPG